MKSWSISFHIVDRIFGASNCRAGRISDGCCLGFQIAARVSETKRTRHVAEERAVLAVRADLRALSSDLPQVHFAADFEALPMEQRRPVILDLFSLKGKVAIVTGASSGLGAEIAVALAQAGADVVCHGNTHSPDATCTKIESSGRAAVAVRGDLRDRLVPRKLVDTTLERFGRMDIVVNNAGMTRRAPATEYSEQDWEAVVEVNLTSAFRLSQIAGKHMIEQGGGKILNIASLLSFQGGITVCAYAAAKGGVAQLTKALANEWAAKKVNVNAIAPGYMRTDITRALQLDETRNRQILERIPAGRWGEPSDLRGAAVFLCSAASDYVNGHVLVVDGGWMGR